MAHKLYDNFYLSNEVEDAYLSHLDLARFVTVDNTLVGTAGMKRVINRYSATGGTEKLAMGEGNTKGIEVSMTPVEYEIQLAQNKFSYYDEQEMTDPMLVPVGMNMAGADLYNTQNADIYTEFAKTTQVVNVTTFDFDAFVDAQAVLNLENLEGVEKFAFVCPLDVAEIRKNMKETLQYVKEFAVKGYVGHIGDTAIFTKKDATEGTIILATKEAVKLFNKKGVEIEQERDANIRLNDIYSRKYYFVALVDETKAVKIVKGA
ncbi:hypothetical protein [Methanobrevibacter sp.]|uniref:hypothetical protein n=1 Tax=Methanobrevibacter sp. TaxID=66852 RepID=UPI00388D2679